MPIAKEEIMGRLNKSGFTLLEVLISIVILSIGLLTMANMQTTAMTGNTSARDMTIAVQLAEEMVDRIRVNAGDTPGIYNGIDTSGACGGADPALGDCTQWQARLAASGLSNATGTVNIVTNNPINKATTITVQVTWGTVLNRTVTFTSIMETWLT